MELLIQSFDLFLRVDKNLSQIVAACGLWTCGINEEA